MQRLQEAVELHRMPLSKAMEKFNFIPKVGTLILSEDGRALLVGNCTPFIQPTTSDGGMGWCYDDWEDFIIKDILHDYDWEGVDFEEHLPTKKVK